MGRLPDQTAFFRDGLHRYADASETVKYFQECVYAALARAFEEKVRWVCFQPLRQDGLLEIGKQSGGVYLYSYIAGAVPNRSLSRAWMTMGLFWNAPLVSSGASVVAAAHCSTENGRKMLGLNRSASDDVFTVGPLYTRSERRLMMHATADFDPELSFKLLLDAADAALALSEPEPPTQVG